MTATLNTIRGKATPAPRIRSVLSGVITPTHRVKLLLEVVNPMTQRLEQRETFISPDDCQSPAMLLARLERLVPYLCSVSARWPSLADMPAWAVEDPEWYVSIHEN